MESANGHTRKRRWIALLGGLLALTAILVVWRVWLLSSVPPVAREALTLGISENIYAIPASVAEERGFFHDERLVGLC